MFLDVHQRSPLGIFNCTSCAPGNRCYSSLLCHPQLAFRVFTTHKLSYGVHHPSRCLLRQLPFMLGTTLAHGPYLCIFAPTNSRNSSRYQHCMKLSFDWTLNWPAHPCVSFISSREESKRFPLCLPDLALQWSYRKPLTKIGWMARYRGP